jgi:glycosyltransferase involved in cell wall biosynthesis
MEELRTSIGTVTRVPTLLPDWINRTQERHHSDRGGILFVGRVEIEKGVPDLLYVAQALRASGELFRMSLVGPVAKSEKWDVEKAIAELGLRDLIDVVGECDEAQVLAHLNRGSILVHPSYVDTYPLVVLEAAAAGLHVIAYDLKGAREIAEEYGIATVVPVGDKEALTEAVLASLQVPPRTEAQVRLRASFAWSKVGDVYERHMNEVLA